MIRFISFLLIILLLSACSSDDNNVNNSENTLVKAVTFKRVDNNVTYNIDSLSFAYNANNKLSEFRRHERYQNGYVLDYRIEFVYNEYDQIISEKLHFTNEYREYNFEYDENEKLISCQYINSNEVVLNYYLEYVENYIFINVLFDSNEYISRLEVDSNDNIQSICFFSNSSCDWIKYYTYDDFGNLIYAEHEGKEIYIDYHNSNNPFFPQYTHIKNFKFWDIIGNSVLGFSLHYNEIHNANFFSKNINSFNVLENGVSIDQCNNSYVFDDNDRLITKNQLRVYGGSEITYLFNYYY